MLSQYTWQVVSQHALQWGVSALGGSTSRECSRGGVAFCYGLLVRPSGMAFWFGGLLIEGSPLIESGLLLWLSVMAFWYGLLIEGSPLIESGLLLWPSG